MITADMEGMYSSGWYFNDDGDPAYTISTPLCGGKSLTTTCPGLMNKSREAAEVTMRVAAMMAMAKLADAVASLRSDPEQEGGE